MVVNFGLFGYIACFVILWWCVLVVSAFSLLLLFVVNLVCLFGLLVCDFVVCVCLAGCFAYG